MTLKYCIFIATKHEAKALLERKQIRQIDEDSYELHGGHRLIITGIGPYAAHLACEKALSDTNLKDNYRWCTIGLCGATCRDTPIGSVIRPSAIGLLSWTPAAGFMEADLIPLVQGAPKERIYTTPIPVHNGADLRIPLPAYIEMEAYPIVRAARKHKKECSVIKVVSDHCTASSPQNISRHMDSLSTTIANEIDQIFRLN